MTITYNGNTYTVMDDSIYCDFSIEASTVDIACEILKSFDGMTDYTFNIDEYHNMVILRRSVVVVGDSITVKIKLREKTDAELAQEELEALRQAMADLATTTNKTTTAKINKILNTEGVKRYG